MIKKILILFLIYVGISSIVYAQTECGRGIASSSRNVSLCNGSVQTVEIVKGYYLDQASALSAANAGMAEMKSIYSNYIGIYGPGSTILLQPVFNVNTSIWSGFVNQLTNCDGSNKYVVDWFYVYMLPGWVDENMDCIKDDNNCLKYKPLMKVTDKTSGCLYFAKIMDENCNVSVLGDSSILNSALSGNVDVEIQSFSAPSRDTESTCSMTSPYYDCNNGFSETACSGIDMTKDDNKNNAKTNEIEDGKYTQNEDLQDGVQSESGDTDSELLAKIVDNTGKFVVNQQNISDQITDIANKIQDKESFENELNNNDLLNKMNADDAEAQAVIDNKSNIIQNADGSDYEEQSNFTEDDQYSTAINEKIEEISPDGKMSGLIDKYTDNALLQTFKNTQIDIIDPECNFNHQITMFGHDFDIEFDFCQFDDVLTTAGNMFYIAVLVGSIIMVLRGK